MPESGAAEGTGRAGAARDSVRYGPTRPTPTPRHTVSAVRGATRGSRARGRGPARLSALAALSYISALSN